MTSGRRVEDFRQERARGVVHVPSGAYVIQTDRLYARVQMDAEHGLVLDREYGSGSDLILLPERLRWDDGTDLTDAEVIDVFDFLDKGYEATGRTGNYRGPRP